MKSNRVGKPMQKIDRKVALIKRMQEELDRRTAVEEEAVQLISAGKHEEAVELLRSLDDSLVTRFC